MLPLTYPCRFGNHSVVAANFNVAPEEGSTQDGVFNFLPMR